MEGSRLTDEALGRWIDRLPREPHGPSHAPLLIDGFAPAGGDDSVRIIPGAVCLEFNPDDVICCERLTDYEEIATESFVPIRLILRSGAQIVSTVHLEQKDEPLHKGRVPFSLAVRADSTFAPSWSRYRELEREFLRRTGLRDQVGS